MDSSQFKPKTLEQVSEALEAVEIARAKKGLSASDKVSLQTASLKLRSIERSIEKTMQDELVDSLNADTADLKALIEQINKSSKKLDKLAEVLEKTAKVVDAFVKIVVTAVGAGLL
jgi:predicted P-loop ATPase/GTPase